MFEEKQITISYNNKKCYDIQISEDFESLIKNISFLNIENKRICIVTEDNVASYYLDTIYNLFKEKTKETFSFVFKEGEVNKNLNTVNELYKFLIKSKFDRNDILVALGGGVVGDLTGFCAATYLRGIKFIQIPTSLLAQVDSSIGGKTAVDFEAYKNMIGAFHQPAYVHININTLKTLNKRQFLSGMGEIIKYGLIMDKDFYEYVKSNVKQILNMENETLQYVIYKSCECKKKIVEEDPTEKGVRAILNYGHTLGHAIEKLSDFKLLHGECVSIGAIAATYISYQKGLLNEEEVKDVIDTHKNFFLPVKFSDISISSIIDATTNDKKMEAGNIKFIVLNAIGKAYIDKTITKEDMIWACNKIRID